mmetsp:Transcript_28566/g.71828  ORF Transcript_28566/g.71828 Transcript_28566/m.71828 type:complete len:203 (-) Transcript_28566:27-635(-)
MLQQSSGLLHGWWALLGGGQVPERDRCDVRGRHGHRGGDQRLPAGGRILRGRRFAELRQQGLPEGGRVRLQAGAIRPRHRDLRAGGSHSIAEQPHQVGCEGHLLPCPALLHGAGRRGGHTACAGSLPGDGLHLQQPARVQVCQGDHVRAGASGCGGIHQRRGRVRLHHQARSLAHQHPLADQGLDPRHRTLHPLTRSVVVCF